VHVDWNSADNPYSLTIQQTDIFSTTGNICLQPQLLQCLNMYSVMMWSYHFTNTGFKIFLWKVIKKHLQIHTNLQCHNDVIVQPDSLLFALLCIAMILLQLQISQLTYIIMCINYVRHAGDSKKHSLPVFHFFSYRSLKFLKVNADKIVFLWKCNFLLGIFLAASYS